MNCWHSLIAYYKMREAINLQELIASKQYNYSKSKMKVSSSERTKIIEGKIDDLQQCTERNCK